MRIDRLRAWGFRLGQLAALALMAALGFVDLFAEVGFGTGAGLVGGAVVGWRVLLALTAAAVWLPRHPSGSRWLAVTAALVSTASLGTTAVAAVMFGGVGGRGWGFAETLGLLGVAFTVARRGETIPAILAVTLTGLAVAALPLRAGQTSSYVIVALFLALCAAAAASGGVYLRMVAASRVRTLAEVRAAQRAEFARDLHDFIAHHVTGIVVQAQGARLIAEADPRRTVTALEQIERAGAETMASMRRMVGVLRDDRAADAPLAPVAGVTELAPLLESFAAAGPPAPRLQLDGELAGLPVEVSTSAYRVVMEALTNVRRHAVGATTVVVSVRRTPDWLVIRVADDGVALRRSVGRESGGYGLVGLAERLDAVAGRLVAGPAAGGVGWVVDAVLPLNGEGRQ